MREAMLDELIRAGKARGATDVIGIRVDDLVFDDRTYLKCLFGCESWGRKHTCPSRPGALKPWEYRRIFRQYEWGLLIHAGDKRTASDAAFALERHAFTRGHYFAFALGDCTGCHECAGLRDAPCRNPRRARPSLHSTGVDVFATARKFGLPVEVLTEEGGAENWYTAVLVE